MLGEGFLSQPKLESHCKNSLQTASDRQIQPIECDAGVLQEGSMDVSYVGSIYVIILHVGMSI